MGKNLFILLLALLFFCFSREKLKAEALMFPQQTDPAEISCAVFRIGFNANGKVATFKDKVNGLELVDVGDPGKGFFARDPKSGIEMFLEEVSVNNDELIVSSKNKTLQAIFKLDQGKRHLALSIESMIGFPKQSSLELHFEMNTVATVKVIEHDYMTQVENSSSKAAVRWRYPSQRFAGDPAGGFSIYYAKTPEEEDDILLEIWGNGKLVHPAVEGEWNYETAKQWLSNWQKTHSNRTFYPQASIMYLSPESKKELYEGAKYAAKAGVSAIYLMPMEWRGEYWLRYKMSMEPNPKIFPKGKEDVKAYSDHLKKQGLDLEFHYVSGGIGFYDPKYVADKPDKRLASWGTGKLANPIDEDEVDVFFNPCAGVSYPVRVSEGNNRIIYNEGVLPWWIYSDYIRIEDELIKVGRFFNTDTQKWRIQVIERGCFNTIASPHEAGSDIIGLVSAYQQVFIPDCRRGLFTEMAKSYAEMINYCNLSQAVFDGIELHDFFYYGQDERYMAEAYKNIDHPVVVHTSRGVPPKCWLEYRFNSTIKMYGGKGWGGHADIIDHHPSRNASTLLEAHYSLSQSAARNTRGYGVKYSDRGVPIRALKNHGLTDELLQTVNSWRQVDKLLNDEQRKIMLATDYPNPNYPLRLAGYHPRSQTVYVLRDAGDRWNIIPTMVMRRSGELDVQWRNGQEHGVVGPRQFVKPGEILTLSNPYQAQPPKFIIQVLHAHDYANAENISFNPLPEEMTNLSDLKAARKEQGLNFSLDNRSKAPYWNELDLPVWNQKVDMSSNRAVGLWVTGDGSNSILVLNVRKNDYNERDYVFRINFKGRRYLEIPKGEVAWADGNWGWRMRTWKFCDYDEIQSIALGLGNIPPETTASVLVEGIKMLKEIPARLDNPVIQIGEGILEIKGSIRSSEFVCYEGGNSVLIYDKNWNKLRKLPVEKKDYQATTGENQFTIIQKDPANAPWLEVQFLTEDTPIIINNSSFAQGNIVDN